MFSFCSIFFLYPWLFTSLARRLLLFLLFIHLSLTILLFLSITFSFPPLALFFYLSIFKQSLPPVLLLFLFLYCLLRFFFSYFILLLSVIYLSPYIFITLSLPENIWGNLSNATTLPLMAAYRSFLTMSTSIVER